MVAKTASRKQVRKAKAVKPISKRSYLGASSKRKIRIGVLTGKNFDPIPVGTQDRNYPERFKFKNNKDGCGGQFHIDVSTGLKMGRLHPDLLEIDLMTEHDITPKRLKKNHVNLNFWYDVGVAALGDDKKHVAAVLEAHEDPECRLYPSWDYYDWVVRKPRYMKQCIKAGIPMIDTIFLERGFDARRCLRDVRAKGWDNFFVKVGHFSFFGNGCICGSTADFLPGGPRAGELEKFAEENKTSSIFLVQPYTLKPNGEVFDEVRNFFIDGKWAYSVFTHGTDESNAGYYTEPAGPRREACRRLAERVYEQVLKASTFEGKPITTLLNRIDIGVVPDKGGDSLKSSFRVFLNEIELEMTTWLARYVPFNLCNTMAPAAVNKARELLARMLNKGRKVPNEANVRRVLKIFDERLGPLDVKLRA